MTGMLTKGLYGNAPVPAPWLRRCTRRRSVEGSAYGGPWRTPIASVAPGAPTAPIAKSLVQGGRVFRRVALTFGDRAFASALDTRNERGPPRPLRKRPAR